MREQRYIWFVATENDARELETLQVMEGLMYGLEADVEQLKLYASIAAQHMMETMLLEPTCNSPRSVFKKE